MYHCYFNYREHTDGTVITSHFNKTINNTHYLTPGMIADYCCQICNSMSSQRNRDTHTVRLYIIQVQHLSHCSCNLNILLHIAQRTNHT